MQETKFNVNGKFQLEAGINVIQSFNDGHIFLSKLINDLEALLNLLKFQDQTWNDTFLGYWWELEQVYALAIDEEKSSLDSEDQIIVNNTLKDLKILIELKLKNTNQDNEFNTTSYHDSE